MITKKLVFNALAVATILLGVGITAVRASEVTGGLSASGATSSSGSQTTGAINGASGGSGSTVSGTVGGSNTGSGSTISGTVGGGSGGGSSIAGVVGGTGGGGTGTGGGGSNSIGGQIIIPGEDFVPGLPNTGVGPIVK